MGKEGLEGTKYLVEFPLVLTKRGKPKKHQSPLHIALNGQLWFVQRGIPVQLPREVVAMLVTR